VRLQEQGYAVRTAATGPEMWIALQNGAADLIILDIMLPGTNGIDLCRQIRRESDVPIIFISARGSEEDRVLGLELGADDFLAKPFGTREFDRAGPGSAAPSVGKWHRARKEPQRGALRWLVALLCAARIALARGRSRGSHGRRV
jgi:CheY-like chemotaxis protein